MPLYEYYCKDCNGVFELLRPARDASRSQPCPECDEDGERIISKDFASFVVREGLPRRIPDDGTYWHYDKKVSSPISGAFDGYNHPELKKPDPNDREPSVEDLEKYESALARQREIEANTGIGMPDPTLERAAQRVRRMRPGEKTRVDQEKTRLLRKIRRDDITAKVTSAGERQAAIARMARRREIEKKEIPPDLAP